eukprot:11480044-Alexandrium_andersonii.AAC.1
MCIRDSFESHSFNCWPWARGAPNSPWPLGVARGSGRRSRARAALPATPNENGGPPDPGSAQLRTPVPSG